MDVTVTRLSGLMRERDVDQSELARKVGATQGAISKILQGKTQNSRLLPKIAMYLGVPLEWLLGGDDETRDSGPSLHERELIDLIRDLDVEDRRAVVRIVRSLARESRGHRPTLHSPQQEFRSQAA